MLAGCAALLVGTLQGPIQAFPAVHDLLDEGGDAGAVIVNLHAQLNMLGGLLVMLVGLTLASWPISAASACCGPSASRSRASLRRRDVLRGRDRDLAPSRPTTSRAERRSARAVARLEPWVGAAARSGRARGADGFSAYAWAPGG